MPSSPYLRFEELAQQLLQGLAPKLKLGVPGIFEFEIDADRLRELMADRAALTLTVERCFVQRRLFRATMDRENLPCVLASAREIREKLMQRAEALSRRGGQNQSHLELVLHWETLTKKLIDDISERIEVLRADAVWARDDPDSAAAIRQYRLAALPIVEALVVVVALSEGQQERLKTCMVEAKKVLSTHDRVKVSEAWNVAAATRP